MLDKHSAKMFQDKMFCEWCINIVFENDIKDQRTFIESPINVTERMFVHDFENALPEHSENVSS